jgi:hypothetical protein
MAESEIRAKLVVKHDPAQVKAESAAAAKSASQGASQAAANIGKLTSVSGEEMQRIMAQRAATKAKWDAIERERAARIAQNERTKPSTGLQQFINQTLGPRPLVGPSGPEFWGKTIPPVLVPPKLSPASQSAGGIGAMFGKLTQGPGGILTSPLAIAAGVGAALAGLRVAVGYVKFAFNALLAPLRMFRDMMKQAAEQARQNYASALRSGGLPLQFVTTRGALAKIIGVGEDEVLQYGSAIAFLTDRIKVSSSIIAGTTVKLTEVSYAWKALSASWSALKSSIMAQFADVTRSFLDAMREIVNGIAVMVPLIMAKARTVIATVAALTGNFAPAVAQAGGGVGGGLEPPSAWSRRMPTSSWEKMGMVVGKMPGDTLKDIARNTMGTWNAIKALNSQGSSAMGNSINFRP